MLPSKNDPYKLYLGDCLDVLKQIPANSIDSVVTDPPYDLTSVTKRWGKDTKFSQNQSDVGKRFTRGFMGKTWDGTGIAFKVELWEAVLRVLKPGGHLLSFGGTRTQHRMVCAIEDAGFEVRDLVSWVYGQGMPKSYDISKAIDKSKEMKREVIGINGTMPIQTGGRRNAEASALGKFERRENMITSPASPEAKQWEGWGSALKPAMETICLARKPLIGTIVENVLEHGTGGLNIDGCRIGYESEADREKAHNNALGPVERYKTSKKIYEGGRDSAGFKDTHSPLGRWPSNMIHDGSDEVTNLFPHQSSGGSPIHRSSDKFRTCYGEFKGQEDCPDGIGGSSGSAARFFYCAKASPEDRAEGTTAGNAHPTVKPVSLMQYLARLITPPRGIVLDPFMGSGSTGKACMMEGFFFIGIEKEEEYFKIAQERIEDKKKKVITWW